MSTVDVTCRLCSRFATPDPALAQHIEKYVNEIDPQFKVDQTRYEERLETCQICPAHSNGICRYCGCFILVRAARASSACPWPGNSKWQ